MSFQEDNYINCPYPILKKKDLTCRQKLIICLIGGFFEGEFHMSNEGIARTLGTTKRTVQREIRILKRLEYIHCQHIYEDGIQVGRVITLMKKKKLRFN